jgi:general secretion pathway protein M
MSALQARIDKLEPRERRLLAIFAATMATFALLALPLYVRSRVTEKREETDALRDLIQSIRDARAQVAERRARRDALLAKYAKPAPPLTGFVESTATANGLSVPESQERPEMPHGKRYSERMVVVKLHKVGMLPLAKTFEKIEQSGLSVSISKLNLKPRNGETDSYEVELGVSAFDRKADVAAPAASSSAAASPSVAPEGLP